MNLKLFFIISNAGKLILIFSSAYICTLYTAESFKPRQPWGFNLSFENYLHLLFAPPATPALKEYPTGSERWHSKHALEHNLSYHCVTTYFNGLLSIIFFRQTTSVSIYYSAPFFRVTVSQLWTIYQKPCMISPLTTDSICHVTNSVNDDRLGIC